MSLPNIQFDPVYDIHLLRGQTISTMPLVLIDNHSANGWLTAHPSVTLSFKALFKGAPNGDNYEGLGIKVDTTNGDVEALPTPQAVEKKNFLLIAEIKDSTDGSTRDAAIRIHVHTKMVEAWLSPPLLTVQRGIDGFKAVIHVLFDDGIVAQIGDWRKGDMGIGIFYEYDILYDIKWSSPTAHLIDVGSGEINPSLSIPLGVHDIKATVTCIGPPIEAKGQVLIEDQLSGTRDDMRAELVSTGNCPGFSKAAEVPNILFLPDGFTSADKDKFDSMVDNYVSDLVRGKISSPFDILSGSINYWKVFVASAERGATHRSEMYIFEKDGKVKGKRLFDPVKPITNNSKDWDFQNLFYHIGPGVPADATKSYSDIKKEWKQTILLSNTDIDKITNSAMGDWKKTSQRRLPEECDSAFGLEVNDYTSAEKDSSFNDINFNAKRMTRTKLNTFLVTLKDTNGNLIGPNFITNGKDFKNILIISSGKSGRDQNVGGAFLVKLGQIGNIFNVVGKIEESKASIYIEIIKDKLSIELKAAITHELGHSFALEDEYGESPPEDTWNYKFTDDPLVSAWQFANFNGSADELDWSGNVQARHDLLSPNPNMPGTGMIDANKIKWRYHRIKKCGVIVSNPVVSGNEYIVKARPGQTNDFAVGDKAFLRKSRRGNPIAIITRVAPPPGTESTISDTITKMISKELDVVNVNKTTDHITVKVTDGSPLPADFLSIGAHEMLIIYNPVPAPSSVLTPTYKYAEVMSKKVLDYLILNPYPMNAKKDSSNNWKEIIDRDAVQNSSIPRKIVPCCSSRKKQIVSLYSNGNQFHGGIYHPTAQCFMRDEYHGKLDEFCAVCKYTLVDIIDASKHGKLDKYISKRKIYPD